MNSKANFNNANSELQVVPAQLADVSAVAELVNRAYRGENGWTRESLLIAGNRTSNQEIHVLLAMGGLHVATIHGQIIGCFNLESKENSVFVGLVASEPDYQGIGLGRRMLEKAQELAMCNFSAKELNMWVVSQRTELIEYYERRGFRKTGTVKPYPSNSGVGNPVVEGLTIQQLTMGI